VPAVVDIDRPRAMPSRSTSNNTQLWGDAPRSACDFRLLGLSGNSGQSPRLRLSAAFRR
jgi:hypothetical protein